MNSNCRPDIPTRYSFARIGSIPTYLDEQGEHYELIVGYATSRAYREVFERIQKHRPDFILLPTKPKQKRLSEFFRHIHLDELIEVLLSVLEKKAVQEG